MSLSEVINQKNEGVNPLYSHIDLDSYLKKYIEKNQR